MTTFLASTQLVGIRRPLPADSAEFVALILASRALHDPWIDLPSTPERYDAYVRSRNGTTEDGYFVCDAATGNIAGVINLNVITRGALQSAYLGYAVGAPFARRGFMTDGLRLVTQHAFGPSLGLHRVEANIQPGNLASIGLVKKCGFRMEGFSPRYLRIGGVWRDHERWALLADEV